MNIATRPTKAEKQSDSRVKNRIRGRLSAGHVTAANLCETLRSISDDVGGLAALQAQLPDGTDAADLVTAYNAARTFATTLNPALSIPDLT